MVFSKSCVALVCVIAFALLHTSYAQDSPGDYLFAHNIAREQVDVGPVFWDESLVDYARYYFISQLNGDCKVVYSEGPFGVNIAVSSGDISGETAVKMWVTEKADYNYDTNTCAPGKVCRDYTQVVWRESVRIGCLKAMCNNGGTVVVCSYDPKGNIDGERPY